MRTSEAKRELGSAKRRKQSGNNDNTFLVFQIFSIGVCVILCNDLLIIEWIKQS